MNVQKGFSSMLVDCGGHVSNIAHCDPVQNVPCETSTIFKGYSLLLLTSR